MSERQKKRRKIFSSRSRATKTAVCGLARALAKKVTAGVQATAAAAGPGR